MKGRRVAIQALDEAFHLGPPHWLCSTQSRLRLHQAAKKSESRVHQNHCGQT